MRQDLQMNIFPSQYELRKIYVPCNGPYLSPCNHGSVQSNEGNVQLIAQAQRQQEAYSLHPAAPKLPPMSQSTLLRLLPREEIPFAISRTCLTSAEVINDVAFMVIVLHNGFGELTVDDMTAIVKCRYPLTSRRLFPQDMNLIRIWLSLGPGNPCGGLKDTLLAWTFALSQTDIDVARSRLRGCLAEARAMARYNPQSSVYDFSRLYVR